MPALSLASTFDVVIPVIIQKGNVSIVSDKIRLANDLIGKRIAYPAGSISHYFILELIHSSGITEEEVRLIPMEVSLMATELNNREIDLFSAWEPSITSAIKQYPGFFITYQKISTGYLYFPDTFVQENPELTKYILAAVVRSIKWLKSDEDNLTLACDWNIESMEKISGERLMLNAKEIRKLAMKDILLYHSIYSIVPNEYDTRKDGSLYLEYEFIRAFHKKNKYRTWEQVAKSFNPDLIHDVLKNPKEFQLNDYNYNVPDNQSDKRR